MSERTEIIEHLKMIQTIIIRMADNSFSIKRWSLSLTLGVLLAIRLNIIPDDLCNRFLIAIPFVVFWGLDAYYLYLERGYRRHYDNIREKEKTTFTLSIKKEKKEYFSALISLPTMLIYPVEFFVIFLIVGTGDKL
jgi:hypothetical protein